jgi:metal-responsive CopG/Arc/MetJ family transcriptional regulator
MPFKNIGISLPEDILDQLNAEAAVQNRDRSNMLRQILSDRYARKPRLEDKIKAGTMKK